MGAWYWSLGKKTGNNDAKGHYIIGKETVDLDCIWKLADLCTGLWDLLIFHSFGGSTSSGFVPLLMKQFLVVYGEKSKLKFAGPPGFHSNGGALQFLPDHPHGPGSFSLCLHGHPGSHLWHVSTQPGYHTYQSQSFDWQIVSTITTSPQFDSTRNVSLTEFLINLVPYPHIHFPWATYSQASQLRPMLSSCLRPRSPMPASNQPVKWPSMTLATASTWFAACGIGVGWAGRANVHTAFTSIRMKCTTQCVDVAQLDLKWASTTRSPIVIPGGDLAKEQQSVYILSNTMPWLRSGPAWTISLISRRQSEHLYIVHGGRHVGRRGLWGPGEPGSSGERWGRGRHGFCGRILECGW